MEESTFMVRYIRSSSNLFKEDSIYEVKDLSDCYQVVSGSAKGFYMYKEDAVRFSYVADELFGWEDENEKL